MKQFLTNNSNHTHHLIQGRFKSRGQQFAPVSPDTRRGTLLVPFLYVRFLVDVGDRTCDLSHWKWALCHRDVEAMRLSWLILTLVFTHVQHTSNYMYTWKMDNSCRIIRNQYLNQTRFLPGGKCVPREQTRSNDWHAIFISARRQIDVWFSEFPLRDFVYHVDYKNVHCIKCIKLPWSLSVSLHSSWSCILCLSTSWRSTYIILSSITYDKHL